MNKYFWLSVHQSVGQLIEQSVINDLNKHLLFDLLH